MGDDLTSDDAAGQGSGARRIIEWVAFGVVVVVAGVGILVFANKHEVADPPQTTVAEQQVPGVTTRLVLDATTLDAGSQVSGKVVVHNTTGAPLHGTMCNGPFAVVLHGSRVGQSPMFPACAQKFSIPSGTSTYPVMVSTGFTSCTDNAGDATSDMPECGGDGKPPALPSGHYLAEVSGTAADMVSSASPVTVEVR